VGTQFVAPRSPLQELVDRLPDHCRFGCSFILCSRLEPAILVVLGAGLLLYGGWLSWRDIDRPVKDSLVLAVALLNVAWIAGSALILVSGVPALTAEGKWTVGVVAVLVAFFAEAQFYALWRMKRR